MGLFDIVGKVLGGNKSKSEQAPWDEAVPYLTGTMSAAGDLFDNGKLGGVDPKFGTLTKRGLSDLTDIGRRNKVTQRATNSLDDMMKGSRYKSGLTGNQGPESYGGIDPNFGIQAVRDNISDTVLPQVASMFGQGGLVNSTTAQQVAADAMTSALAPVEYDQINRNQSLDMSQFNTEQDRGIAFDFGKDGQLFDQFATKEGLKLQGVGLAPMVNQMQYGDAETLFNVGQINDVQTAQNKEANKTLKNVNAAANFFLPFGGLGGTGSQTGSALDGIGKIGQALTGGAQAYSACDRRLKRDITRVGTWRGVAIYTFRYLWDDVLRIGPMAQEVPERARIKVGDFYAVDMRAI